jgi:type IV secretion system protein VirD4
VSDEFQLGIAWFDRLPPRVRAVGIVILLLVLVCGLAAAGIAGYRALAGSAFLVPGAVGAAVLVAIIALAIWRGGGFFPRLWLWKLGTFGLWLLGLLLVLAAEWQHFRDSFYFLRFLTTSPYAEADRWRAWTGFFNDAFDIKSNAVFRAWLALWVLAALLLLLRLGNRPLRWMEFKRFRWVFLGSLACAGYLPSAFLYEYLNPLGPDDALTVLRFVAPPLLLPFAGLVLIGALALITMALTFVFRFMLIALPLKAFDFFTEQDIQAHIRREKKRGIAGYFYRFHYWLRGMPVPEQPDDGKGARFANAEDIAAARAPDTTPTAMGFGHVGGAVLPLDTDKHVLIMASTRSGKGVTLIIPHLLRYRGSAFVLDPKGENARATGRQRAKLNGAVHYLDPFGISGKPRSRFNPLAHFKPETMEAQSKSLAAALILETTRDHWTASAQQLLAAVILYVVATPELPPAKKDLVLVRKLLLGTIDTTLEDMSKCDLADGLVADLAMSFLKTPERERGSIISTAQRETEILDNPGIIACLSATGPGREVDFATWHSGTMSVFLCLSAPRFPVFNRWLRLVLTAALDEMTDRLNPPPLPVCFMLDELATLGHLSTIENAVGLAAGYGVQLVSVFQDVAQMRDLYKGRWASFIGNSGIRALFSLDDFETADYWSKFIGGRLFPTSSEQRDLWGLAQSASASEAMRPFMSPEELMMRYARDLMLVLKQGHRPIEAQRIAYWRDPTLNGLWDDPRKG